MSPLWPSYIYIYEHVRILNKPYGIKLRVINIWSKVQMVGVVGMCGKDIFQMEEPPYFGTQNLPVT